MTIPAATTAVPFPRREVRVSSLHEPISHYTDAVMWGDLVFVSGCTASNQDLLVEGGSDAAAQTRKVLQNLGEILAAAGTDFAHVLKVTVYLTDINDRAVINPVRQEFFGSARPASTLVEVSALAIPGAKVEIDAVACRPSDQPRS